MRIDTDLIGIYPQRNHLPPRTWTYRVLRCGPTVQRMLWVRLCGRGVFVVVRNAASRAAIRSARG